MLDGKERRIPYHFVIDRDGQIVAPMINDLEYEIGPLPWWIRAWKWIKENW